MKKLLNNTLNTVSWANKNQQNPDKSMLLNISVSERHWIADDNFKVRAK